MGGKSVRSRADAHKARQQMQYMSMKKIMEEKASLDKTPPFTGECICQFCGFKARYQFIRCPQCEKLHEKTEEEKTHALLNKMERE